MIDTDHAGACFNRCACGNQADQTLDIAILVGRVDVMSAYRAGAVFFQLAADVSPDRLLHLFQCCVVILLCWGGCSRLVVTFQVVGFCVWFVVKFLRVGKPRPAQGGGGGGIERTTRRNAPPRSTRAAAPAQRRSGRATPAATLRRSSRATLRASVTPIHMAGAQHAQRHADGCNIRDCSNLVHAVRLQHLLCIGTGKRDSASCCNVMHDAFI